MDEKVIPRGIRNNNPLNIRKGNNWKGEVKDQTDRSFEQFVSMEYGIRAGFKILRNYITGFNGLATKINTIEGIIRRWAPPRENDTESYIKKVVQLTGIPRTQRIAFGQKSYMCAIVDAMIRVECGQPVDMKVIESGYDLV